MKRTLLYIVLCAFCLSQSEGKAQTNPLKKVTSMKKTVKSAAERNYERLTTQLEETEKVLKEGKNIDAYIKDCEKFISWVKKADPNFDTSKEETRVAELKTTSSGKVSNDEEWRLMRKRILKYYDKSHIVNVRSMFFNSKLIEDTQNFDLEFVKRTIEERKANGRYDGTDEETENAINDYASFITDIKLDSEFLQRLDQAAGKGDTKNPVVTLDRAKQIKHEAEAVFAFAPNNPDIQNVVEVANRSIQQAESSLESVYTSAFHKEHLGQIVFSKKPLTIGSEKESDITTNFKTGDAIYGTVYLGRSIGEMIGDDAYNIIGATGFTLVLNLNSVFGHMEKWEADSFPFHHHVSVSVNHTKDTYIQLVLLPETPAVLNDPRYEYVKRKNYTPVIFARGLRAKSKRNLPIEAYFTAGDRSGFQQKFEGKFEMDLSFGEGPDYYKDVENSMIDKYIEDNEIPKPAFRDAALEKQVLNEMNSKGWRETFVQAVLASNWVEEIVPGGSKRRLIDVFLVAKHPDGYCFYNEYSLVSYPSGGGWTKAEYFSSGVRTRVLCSKVK